MLRVHSQEPVGLLETISLRNTRLNSLCFRGGVLKPRLLGGYQLQIWVSPTMMPGHWQLGRGALILYHFLGDWSQFV